MSKYPRLLCQRARLAAISETKPDWLMGRERVD